MIEENITKENNIFLIKSNIKVNINFKKNENIVKYSRILLSWVFYTITLTSLVLKTSDLEQGTVLISPS